MLRIMDDHRARVISGMASDRKAGRRADAFAGYAFMGLSLSLGVLTLIMDELAVPAWIWAGILAVWCITTNLSVAELLNRTGQLLLYGTAVLTSWVLLVTVSNSSTMTVMLLVAVAAVGSYLIALRWVFSIVLLNCLVIFGHGWWAGADLAEAVSTAIFYLIIHVAVVFSGYAMSRETQLRAELEQNNLELEAAGVLLADSAASAERMRISRELHDLIGHQLTVLNLELEAAKHREGAAAGEHIDRAGAVAKELLADVRSTVGQLRQDHPGDLQDSLQRLAGAVPSLEIHVDVDAAVLVDEEISATLVRAAQEIITNTVKHSEATELLLTITLDEGTVTLSGINDGTPPRTITLGHGLTGLRERLELLGGHLKIHTTGHFTVEAQVPVTADWHP